MKLHDQFLLLVDNLLEVHLEARKVVEAIYDSKDTAQETPKSAKSDEEGHHILSDEFLMHNEFKISQCKDSVDSERVQNKVIIKLLID